MLAKGVELIDDVAGSGQEANKGSQVRYAVRLFLRRGDEVSRDAELIAAAAGHLETQVIDGAERVLHSVELGKRQAIAGIEKALVGMKEGGYREIRVAPHLAYGERGVPGSIPANAVLRIKLWLVRVSESGS